MRLNMHKYLPSIKVSRLRGEKREEKFFTTYFGGGGGNEVHHKLNMQSLSFIEIKTSFVIFLYERSTSQLPRIPVMQEPMNASYLLR